VRRLIINADDFGMTSGVNRGIVEAAKTGVVTSTTLMANSSRFDEAVHLAKSSPALGVGCHAVLIQGIPMCSGLAPLTNGSGRFKNSIKDFAQTALRGKLAADELQNEIAAQIGKIQQSGLMVTHIDSHKHTHMFPQVLRPALRAARECGVSGVRNPFEPARAWAGRRVLATPAMWVRCAGVSAFRVFAGEFRKAVAEAGMKTTDGTVGIAATGKLDEKMLEAMLKALPDGTWELVCHPGYSDTDLLAAETRLTNSREVELQALTSEAIRKTVAGRGIQLISFADL
jgi:hopanoid biosynthesis associated protein HpnK